MKRKLISFDVFESIQRDSLSSAELELIEAEDVLAKALEVDEVNLLCYGPEDVVYESSDSTFIHMNYVVTENAIEFQNIEELIIDSETEKAQSKKVISDMLDALIENNNEKANELFDSYMDLPSTKRNINEVRIVGSATTGRGRRSKFRGRMRPGGHAAALKAARTRKRHSRMIGPGMKKKIAWLHAKEKRALGGRAQRYSGRQIRSVVRIKDHMVKEWFNLTDNVMNYLEAQKFGPILNESHAEFDEKGNVIALRIPNVNARNEAKLLSFNWKTLDTDVKVLRSNAMNLSENADFRKAIAELKRQNALSEADAFQEGLENLVTQYPGLIYLTQNELAGSIADILEQLGNKNYDDATCDFIAEGILRTAHEAYVDRVHKIMKLAGVTTNEEAEDKYAQFRNVVDQFYPHIDENASNEMQVFVDLYETLRKIYDLSVEQQNWEVKSECDNFLKDLQAVIEQQMQPSLELAADAAEYINYLLETNLDSKDWKVSNTPHVSVNGDHPDMANKASQGYSPSGDGSGNYNDPAPVSDGNWKLGRGADMANKMRNNAWGNVGGKDTWPSLNNPNVLNQFGTFKMKGAEDDEDNGLVYKSGNTWPELQNPVHPKAETPQSYKMNGGKESDLVVDK